MTRLRPMRCLAAILGIAMLSTVAVTLLPNSTYEKFQLLDGTIYESLRWSYERIHFDSRPVDVAIVGPSTSVLGLSAARMESDLAGAGKRADVANFSIIAAGRNIEWATLDELYKAKSPKVIVIAVDQAPTPYGHPAFKYVAPALAVAFPPALFLHNYFYDISYLPFRQIELFAAWLFPDAFGLSRHFDPERYARFPTDFTVTHGMHDGQWIDMDREIPRDRLLAEARRHSPPAKRDRLPAAIGRIIDADDHVYIRQIAREAASHGTRLVFVYTPRFEGGATVRDRAFLEHYGLLLENGDMADDNRLFQGWSHFNHAGAMALSDRVAKAIAPYL